jgi:two-component system cell cycle sensor histidine kinase/response regulator CckA
MNLCVNARDAMPDGGRLTITTSLVVLDAGSALPHAHPDARAGRFASLEVADTGHGMSVETQRRIFEPFFTTKDVGKGTGLGLATTHGLVSQHHGWIEVESEPDRGSTFHVFLPALEKVPAAEQPDAEPLVRGGSATILVVEDEALIRQMVVRSLRRLGYRVLEVENGAEALEMWADEQGRVDLVLTDMVMPGGLSGIDLSRQLQRMKPDLKVVIMSGYATRLVGDESVLTRDIEFLSKPFSLATLGEVVRRALDRADGDGRREGGREEPAPSRRRGPRARPGPTKK